jgi:putative transposase
MPDYRRAFQPGGTFFFTLVTERRAPLFAQPSARRILREALNAVRTQRTFVTDAIVLLPDHLHVIWTLPSGDSDFSGRWASIKAQFTRNWIRNGGGEQPASAGRARKGGRGVWQERFWEHVIRDQDDLNRHVDYIHYNPVNHGWSTCPHAFQFSSFSRWVHRDFYLPDWQCICEGRHPERLDFSWASQFEME